MLFGPWIAILGLLPQIVAPQTWTSCNPLNRTDCPTDVALGTNHTFDFTTSQAGSSWNTTAGNIVYGANGAEFTIRDKGDSPTIQTNFYILFGVVEVWLKASSGQGVVSSSVLQSDDLDEIDWEFIGSNTTFAETNYYGKGNTTNEFERSKWHPMADTTAAFHNYTVRWTRDSIDWYIDGESTRTLAYEDATGGQNYPQTPMNVRIGIWPAGDSKNNNYTIAWAGGEIDYSKGPYTMFVKSCRISDFSSGREYKYGDQSGSWQSIQVTEGNSSIAENLTGSPSRSMEQRWQGLSQPAKLAIGTSIAAAFLAAVGLYILYFIRQRQAGRQERAIEDTAYDKDTAELLQYRTTFGTSGAKNWERL